MLSYNLHTVKIEKTQHRAVILPFMSQKILFNYYPEHEVTSLNCFHTHTHFQVTIIYIYEQQISTFEQLESLNVERMNLSSELLTDFQ